MLESASDYVFSLDQDTQKYCEEVLHETEESRRSAFENLSRWIAENPQLHVKPDARSLLAFLRGCKFDLDKTKTKLKNYYTMRRDVPEWFSNRDPKLPEIQELVKLGVFIPLVKALPGTQQMVIILRTAAHDPRKHSINDVMKVGKMLLEVATIEMEKSQIFGVTAIFDMSGTSLGHARQLTPGIIKKSVHAWQNYHCRPKHLNFINAPISVNVVLNIFKSFMSEKLKKRIDVVGGGLEGLHRIVPREVLPVEYGGEGESLDVIIQHWNEVLMRYAQWFLDDEKYKAD